MGQRALAALPAIEYTLTVMNGPEKGTVYRLMAPKITIGRGSENDVVIADDPKVSRRHAKIAITPTGIIISDMSDHNKVIVNGSEVKAKTLENNTEFVLGETRFRFNVAAAAPVAAPAFATPQVVDPNRIAMPAGIPPGMPPGMPRAMGGDPNPPADPSRRRKKGTSGRRNFYIVVGVVGLVVYWLLSDDPNAGKKKDIDIRTEQQVEADIKAAQQMVEAQELERKQQGKDSPQYKSAQTHFVQGFRDYQSGQFERALESFQACLSIFPPHLLCQRYQGLAQKRYSELVQYHMILGRKYFEQNQFKACMASFRNVLFMVRDTNSAVYKEALANYQKCQRLQEDRF